MPPFGSAQFRLEPGGQRLQGIFVGRRGEGYRRRLQRLTVLLRRRMQMVVMVVVVMVTSLADRLTARQLVLLL